MKHIDLEPLLVQTNKEAYQSFQRAMMGIFNLRKITYMLPDMELPDNTDIQVRVWSAPEISITIPRDFELIARYRTALVSMGWKEVKQMEVDFIPGTMNYEFTGPEVRYGSLWYEVSHIRLELWAQPNKTGATCVVRKIGERIETKTIPVYETVCKAAAEEDEQNAKTRSLDPTVESSF